MARSKHLTAGISTSSLADIAFLMLSYFLMTTVIDADQGLMLTLPEWHDQPLIANVHQRDVFNIHLNSADAVMIEGEISSLEGLSQRVRNFVMNNARDANLSKSPATAIVSLRSDRGTSYGVFIRALDEIQTAYYEIYAERAGISVEQYRRLNMAIPAERNIIEQAKFGIPMNISLANSAQQGATKLN
jgi:biopolymer transport protein ExbD